MFMSQTMVEHNAQPYQTKDSIKLRGATTLLFNSSWLWNTKIKGCQPTDTGESRQVESSLYSAMAVMKGLGDVLKIIEKIL